MNRTMGRRCAPFVFLAASALGFARPAVAAEALRVPVGQSILVIPGGYVPAGTCPRQTPPGPTPTGTPLAPDTPFVKAASVPSAACPVINEPVWDDFSESYLYADGVKPVRWVTVSTGFFFGPKDPPCRSVPGVAGRSLRVTKDGKTANARLFSPASRSQRAAVLQRFADSGSSVALPPTDVLRQILVNCASGEAIFVWGSAAPLASLRRIVQDNTDGGRLVMVDWVPASNPKIDRIDLVDASKRPVSIEAFRDPRTAEGYAARAAVRGRVGATPSVIGDGRTISWIIAPSLAVRVSSPAAPTGLNDEQLRVFAESLAVALP